MKKKVLIALKMSAFSGQEKLAGIFRFLGLEHNWDIALVRNAAELTSERIRKAIADGCDGFIISIPKAEKATALLARSRIPMVVMDLYDAELARRRRAVSYVRNSHVAIGVAAADFLLSTGRCRTYAYIHNQDIAEWSTRRHRAFRESLLGEGLWCNELAGPDGLSALDKPVGVLVANDDRGFDVLEYCRSNSLRVPEDVLLLGIDNDPLICENCRPSLSSIQPNFNEEGFIAARELSRMMDMGREELAALKPKTFFVGVTTIMRRNSTADTSNAGRMVQKALMFIRDNACRGISVADVANHIGCSRRLADLRFHELQGTTIGAMITSTRLEEVLRLLRSTRQPIDGIAASCGYANPTSLKNLFKKRFGISMREYRRQPERLLALRSLSADAGKRRKG